MVNLTHVKTTFQNSKEIYKGCTVSILFYFCVCVLLFLLHRSFIQNNLMSSDAKGINQLNLDSIFEMNIMKIKTKNNFV